MLVYRPHEMDKPSHTLLVQPGVHYPVSDWLDEAGKPRMYSVVFRSGRAEVPDNLGQYLIDQQLAQSSPILLI